MLKEFKAFLMRGNVVDLAVAVVIGAAFTAIVNSLVNDIIMPIIGVIIGGLDFTSLGITVGDSVIAYVNFLQAVINFVLIGLVLFFIVKGMNKMAPKKEAAPPPPPGPTNEEKLLGEIRDLLRKQAR